VIAQIDQGGLGLPERDYYVKQDAESEKLRRQYVEHVARMFVLAGEQPAVAKAHAETVMKIETALAQGSLDIVSRRDPEKVYHKMSEREMEALTPAFAWKEYLRQSGSPDFAAIDVAWPGFLQALNGAIQHFTLEDWKVYLTWHLLHSDARLLAAALEAVRPVCGWRLGEALGTGVRRADLRPDMKARTLTMTKEIEKAMEDDINNCPG
jgi:putative endopeptidase